MIDNELMIVFLRARVYTVFLYSVLCCLLTY